MTAAPIKGLTPEKYLRPNHFLSSFYFLLTSWFANQYSVTAVYDLECVGEATWVPTHVPFGRVSGVLGAEKYLV